MISITADIPCEKTPAWALLQRHLFATLDESVVPYLEAYTHDNGYLKWDHETAGSPDDFYEAFFNWPLLYTIGGGDHLASLADKHWEAVTTQLTGYGLVEKEYARAEDQFHQAESDIFFYLLCQANPSHINAERARRFAGLYMNEDPNAENYDPAHSIIRSPVNGSGGANMDHRRSDDVYGFSPGMARYGLPFYDVPGISKIEDLKNLQKARAMGRAMYDRMRLGDAVTNLAVTSLVTNAYLLTGDEKCREWVLNYVEVWQERARNNDDLIPDNVGLSGTVGEYTGGKWYGALYGWTWPHGFYNIQMASQVAAANAYLLTSDNAYLEMPRRQLDRIWELGEMRDVRREEMSLAEHWIGQFRALGNNQATFMVPHRYGTCGWFDWQPLSPIFPVALWYISMEPQDRKRVQRLLEVSGYNWSRVISFRNKEDAGHEQPWIRFLDGNNPHYCEEIVQATLGEINRRLELIRSDEEADTHRDVHRWQEVNPVSTEALVQLTLGAPQSIYNGGLPLTRLRYFDPARRRPGLPQEVAALVEILESNRTVLRLVNTGGRFERRVLLQAGGYAEHRFGRVCYGQRTSPYPGTTVDYAAPPLTQQQKTTRINQARLEIVLPPGREICLDLETQLFANRASASLPW